jgi:hypothetical protein
MKLAPSCVLDWWPHTQPSSFSKHTHSCKSSRTHSLVYNPSAYTTTNRDFQSPPNTTTTCSSYKASHNSSNPDGKSHSTCLRKIRAHTNIYGNDLADAATKLAVTNYDSIPQAQTMRMKIGAILPRPPFWAMYT